MMAEGSSRSSHGELEDLEEKIRRLEREKNDLQRRKEREERERRSALQRDDASSPRDSASAPKRGHDDDNSRDRNRRSADNYSAQLSSTLEESQLRLKSLFNSSLGGASNYDDPQDDTCRSSDDGDGDDVMSQRHKQILRSNRDVLVENMTPDDIFNDLISKHIFSNADVSRIKERNTVEAINEELLNLLVRRSDRAFHVFVASLRRTLQGWLANRIDPAVPGKNKRKRRTGEVNVNVDCQEVTPSSKKKYTCTCHEVEEQILQMARGAFANIRRRDTSASAHEQFRKELQQTNDIIRDSLEIMNTLKLLCKHGELTNLSTGSIRFTILCKSLLACHSLWEEYKSGLLLSTFQEGFITKSLLRACGAKKISLRVRIDEADYLQCAFELGCASDDIPKENQLRVTPVKCRLRQRPRRNSNRLYQSQGRGYCQSVDKAAPTKHRQVFRDMPTNAQSPVVSLPLSRSHLKCIDSSGCENCLCNEFSSTRKKGLAPSKICVSRSLSYGRDDCCLYNGYVPYPQRLQGSLRPSETLLERKFPAFLHGQSAFQKRHSGKTRRKHCLSGRSLLEERSPQCRYNLRHSRVQL
ncbi:uncharacterized protein LOC101861459 [Aplysia californica]|uniref:Uncharacterized protein LOC101861459 n=1 Tax=Aplysia californica TaxID=6500 RepID=A0ABM0JZQ9_APLCA|nr:uncharacterized protein LOC101861459 [Aplysia californica]